MTKWPTLQEARACNGSKNQPHNYIDFETTETFRATIEAGRAERNFRAHKEIVWNVMERCDAGLTKWGKGAGADWTMC